MKLRQEKLYAVICRPVFMAIVIAVTIAVALTLVLVVGVAKSRPQVPPVTLVEETTPRVQRLLSYTPATVENDLRLEQAYLTGDYREQYAEYAQSTLIPQAIRDGVSVQVQVTETAIIDATATTLVLLMIGDLATTKDELRGGATEGRFRVTLQLEDGSWLIDGIDVV